MIKGSIVALVTPMTESGELDLPTLNDLLEWHIQEGTDAIVAVGTTGESPTLSIEENCAVVDHVVKTVKGRVPVIAGTGANSTQEAIEMTAAAKESGADACLLVTPYYNKPTQEGLYQHFKAVNDAVGIPIFIYNIPGRSVVDMSLDTFKRLADLQNIAGVKDATADLARPVVYANALPDDFCLFSGEDATAIPYLVAGGHGCISVTANIAPALCAQQHEAWQAGDVQRAMDIQQQLIQVHSAMFCESSPGPVKYAAELMGLCSSEMRLPMCEIADSSKIAVEKAVRELGLIG